MAWRATSSPRASDLTHASYFLRHSPFTVASVCSIHTFSSHVFSYLTLTPEQHGNELKWYKKTHSAITGSSFPQSAADRACSERACCAWVSHRSVPVSVGHRSTDRGAEVTLLTMRTLSASITCTFSKNNWSRGSSGSDRSRDTCRWQVSCRGQRRRALVGSSETNSLLGPVLFLYGSWYWTIWNVYFQI